MGNIMMSETTAATKQAESQVGNGTGNDNRTGSNGHQQAPVPTGGTISDATADTIVSEAQDQRDASTNGHSVMSGAAAAMPRRMQTGPAAGENSAGQAAPTGRTKIDTKDLNLFYGSKQALKGINTQLREKSITALIGPSGCGKSTYLRCINRMNDLIENVKITGEVNLEGENIYSRGVDVVALRQRVGMVFQKPNPFPMSIFDNISYGPRLNGIRNKNQLREIVEESLNGAALWNEVKDDLKKSALALSGGQQQRLCIARAMATKPEVLLMDEPASALDPISTLKIEELMRELKEHYTIIIVTHNMQQAARVSDHTGFFLLGELVEMDSTSKIFTDPNDKRTEDYITGRFG
jgi:phosphate transport system ATP-binding protein